MPSCRTWVSVYPSTINWPRSARFVIGRVPPGDIVELRQFIGDRSNVVVAMAAELVAARSLAELADQLEAAFDRFLVDPLKNDKLCRAKLAIVQALDKVEHRKREIFEKAAKHVQLEPAFVIGGESTRPRPSRRGPLCSGANRWSRVLFFTCKFARRS